MSWMPYYLDYNNPTNKQLLFTTPSYNPSKEYFQVQNPEDIYKSNHYSYAPYVQQPRPNYYDYVNEPRYDVSQYYLPQPQHYYSAVNPEPYTQPQYYHPYNRPVYGPNYIPQVQQVVEQPQMYSPQVQQVVEQSPMYSPQVQQVVEEPQMYLPQVQQFENEIYPEQKLLKSKKKTNIIDILLWSGIGLVVLVIILLFIILVVNIVKRRNTT